MGRISKDVEELERFEHIVETVARHGFNILLKKLKLERHVHLHHRVLGADTRGPEEFREMLEELGTVYIKMGQILAERPDLVPENYRKELEKLEHDTNPVEYGEIEGIVEEEVGTESFDSIEEEPIASASIAQVHRGTYRGEDVVLKVRKPGIEERVEEDLKILEYITQKGEKHLSKLKSMSVLKFVQEFSQWTRQELDFRKEAENAKLFKENLENDEHVKVPKIYEEVSTEKILVLEYIEGVKCTEEERLQEMHIRRKEIAENAIEAGMTQAIRDGFFHADPHPSNFLITEDSQLVYLDFGMMGSISQDQSRKLGLMLLYLMRDDADGLMDVLEDLGTTSQNYNRAAIRKEVEKKIRIIKNSTLEETSITRQMFDLFVVASDNGLQMPSSLTLMGKSLVTMEGIGITIYPEFKIQEQYEETAEKLLKEQNSIREITEDLSIDLIKNKDLISNLPSKINNALEPQQQKPVKVVQESSNDHLLPAALLIGSTILFYHVLPETQMALVAWMELLAAVYFLR